jgi:hypothetical protein
VYIVGENSPRVWLKHLPAKYVAGAGASKIPTSPHPFPASCGLGGPWNTLKEQLFLPRSAFAKNSSFLEQLITKNKFLEMLGKKVPGPTQATFLKKTRLLCAAHR